MTERMEAARQKARLQIEREIDVMALVDEVVADRFPDMGVPDREVLAAQLHASVGGSCSRKLKRADQQDAHDEQQDDD